MAVEAQVLYNEYLPNGSTSSFAFTFDIMEADQITVTLQTIPTGSPIVQVTPTVQVQDVDYTVTMVGSPIEGPQAGNITWIGSPLPPNTDLLRIERVTDVIRTQDYVEGGSLLAQTLDNDQDYQTHILQELDANTLQTDSNGDYDAGGANICGVGSPESCVMTYDTADDRYVNVTGDTMSGNLIMAGNLLYNPGDPTNDSGVGDRGYNDARYVELTGDTMTGDLLMGNNDITGIGFIDASTGTFAGNLTLEQNLIITGNIITTGLVDTVDVAQLYADFNTHESSLNEHDDVTLTTPAKGSILAHNGAGLWLDLDIGTDDYVLTADSTAATGVAWKIFAGFELSDLTDVGDSTPTDKNALMANGTTFESRPIVEADVSDLDKYTTAQVDALIVTANDNAVAMAIVLGG